MQVHENAYGSGDHHCFSAKSASTGDAVDMVAEGELADVSVLVGRQGCLVIQHAVLRGYLVERTNLQLLTSVNFNIRNGLCIASSDPNQPAEVLSVAPKHMHPGACLYHNQASQLSCKGYHPLTRRLCPCA